MRERGTPTPGEVVEHAMASPRLRPLIEEHYPLWLQGPDSIPLPSFNERSYFLPPLPAEWPPFASIDFTEEAKQTDFLNLSTSVGHTLARAKRTNLAELIQLNEEESLTGIRSIGPMKAEKIRYHLELFRLYLRGKQVETPDQLLILVFTDETLFIIPGPPLAEIELPKPATEEVAFEERLPSTYQFKFPGGEEDLTEFRAFVRLGFLTDRRIINLIERHNYDFRIRENSRVTDISHLRKIVDGEIRLYRIGKEFSRRLGLCLEKFDNYVADLQEKTPGEGLVVIEVPAMIGPERQMRVLSKRHFEILAFVSTWLLRHPGKKGFGPLAARKFGITSERVRQIIHQNTELLARDIRHLFQEDGERPITLATLAKELERNPEDLIISLREERISLGHQVIDGFFQVPSYPPSLLFYKRLPVIFPSLINMDELRRQLEPIPPSTPSINEIMAGLTLNQAIRNRDTFISLYYLAQKANPHISRQEVPAIFKDLVKAGFCIRMIEIGSRQLKYYFVHRDETQEIVKTIRAMPEGKYGLPKIFIFSVKSDEDQATAITTFEFADKAKFVSAFRVLREAVKRTTSSSLHPKYYEKLLRQIINQRLITVPIFYHKPKGSSFKIRDEDCQRFRDEISAHAEEIAISLEALRRPSP